MKKNFLTIPILVILLTIIFSLWAILSQTLNFQPKVNPPASVINTFEECVAAGYPVIESFPERCQTPDKRTFTNENNPPASEKIVPPKQNEKICADKCGDKECQEVVCLGTGCPCQETKQTCPQDCGQAQPRNYPDGVQPY